MKKSELIQESERIFGKDKFNFDLIPETFYKSQRLTFICLKHNEHFEQSAYMHLLGHIECSECINEIEEKNLQELLLTKNVSKESTEKRRKEFILKAEKLYGDQFNYDSVVYINNKIKVKIYCNKHKKYFWTEPAILLSKTLKYSPCPYCSKEERIEQIRLESEKRFISKSIEKYGDIYDYSKIHYINETTKVEIICKKHNKSFFKTPINHLTLNQGCPYCKKEECRAGFRVSFEEFVQEAKKKFGDRFEYSKEHFVNMGTKMTIYCKKHNYYFEQAPRQHLISQCGCPLCSKEEFGHIPIKMSKEMFIERSKEIFGDDTFDYSRLEYINIETPVELYCNIHKVWFKVIPEKHLCRHQGCPECNNAESCLEKEVRLLLERNDIKFEKEKKFKWLKYKSNMRLDFYLPELNIAIECHGPQHFIQAKNIWSDTPEKLKITQERDQLKNEQCKEHNIQILYYSTVYLSRRISDNYFLGHIITSKEELLERILEIQNANN